MSQVVHKIAKSMHQEGKIVGVLLLLATLSALWFVFNFFDFKTSQSAKFLKLAYSSKPSFMNFQEDSNEGHVEVILNNSTEEIKWKNEVFFWSTTEMTLHENVKKRIEKMCLSAQSSKLKVEDSSIKHNLMVDLAHKLAYCRHGKVGTTTFMEHFSKLLPEKVQQNKRFDLMSSHKIHSALPAFFSAKKLDLNYDDDADYHYLNDYLSENGFFSFSFVRHPFDRLVSAYYDKIISGDDASYLGRAKKIMDKYGEITFSNFVRYVIAENGKYEQCQKTLRNHCSNIDVHWRPFYLRCAYCLIDYSFIGRMETFAKDVSYVIRVNNLTSLIPLEDAEHQSHSTKKAVPLSLSEQLTKDGYVRASKRAYEEFSRVGKSLIATLYHFYKPDFDLFLYSIAEFL